MRFPVTTAVGRSTVHAVKDLSFQIRRGSTLGLVGESGSGKSTVAAALTGLVEPDSGSASLDGVDVLDVRGRAEKALRRRISLVFQDPFSSLNPRTRAGTAIAEPLQVHRLAHGKQARQKRVGELLELVGLSASFRVALPTRAFRRPTSTRQHRPRPRHRTRPSDPRRIDGVAGCLGPVARPRPARTAATRTASDLPVHRARSARSSNG